MKHVNLADAKARLSELVAEAEGGEVIEITRRGKVVARLGPAESKRQPIDIDRLRRLTAKMTPPTLSTDESIREWKEDERY